MPLRKSTGEELHTCEDSILRVQAEKTKNIREDALAIVDKILGINLWPMQREILDEFYGGGYRELVLNCGMRAGKSFIGAVIAAVETIRWILLDDPWGHYGIHPTTQVYGLITATTERQAQKRSAFTYFRQIVQDNWWFQQHGAIVQELGVKFPGRGIEIQAIASSSAGQAGGTLLFAILEELARFVETEGSRGGDLVYDTLKAGCKTLNGVVASISSPIYINDKIMRLTRKAEEARELAEREERKPSMLVYHLPTWGINPNLTRDDFEEEFATNPETAKRDWLAQPSYAIEPYFAEPELLDNITGDYDNPRLDSDGTISGISYDQKFKYYLHGDPAPKNDAFGIAVAHHDDIRDRIVVDMVHRFLPEMRADGAAKEVDARFVRQTLLRLVRAYHIKDVTFDTWNFPETVQALRDERVTVENLVIRKEQYETFKERVYEDPPRVIMPRHTLAVPPKNTRMPTTAIEEFKQLDRIKGEKIDHPTRGCKDVADSVVGAVYQSSFNIRRRQNRSIHVG